MSIIDSRDKWPFPAITEARKTGDDWVEISEEHADQLLNCMPPIYIPGGFMVSEAAAHDERNVPIYCAVIKLRDRYFAREMAHANRNQAQGMAIDARNESEAVA